MIKATDIYAVTHDGLDIILYYYPQAEGCVDNKKKFKRRPDEDDASAGASPERVGGYRDRQHFPE